MAKSCQDYALRCCCAASSATGAQALRNAACFPRASGGQDPGLLRCARFSVRPRSSGCEMRGNLSSWPSPTFHLRSGGYCDRCVRAVIAITKMRFLIGNGRCPIRRQIRPRNSQGSGIRLHGDRRCAFAHLKGVGKRLHHSVTRQVARCSEPSRPSSGRHPPLTASF